MRNLYSITTSGQDCITCINNGENHCWDLEDTICCDPKIKKENMLEKCNKPNICSNNVDD